MGKNYLEKEKYYWLKFIFDGILLLFSFLLIYFFKRGHINIEDNFIKFLPILFICWFFVTLFSKKFLKVRYENIFFHIRPFIFSIAVMIGLISLSLYILGWYYLSRFIVYGTIGIFLIMETFYLSFRILFWQKRKIIKYIPFSISFFFIELLVILFTFLSLYFFRKGTLELKDDYLVLLMAIFFIWLLISFLFHRFTIRADENYLKTMFQFWRSEIIIVGSISFIIFILDLSVFSRFIILGSLLIFSIIENFIVTFYYIYSKKRKTDEIETSFFKAEPIEYPPLEIKEKIPEEKKKFNFPGSRLNSKFLSQQLKNLYLNKFEKIYMFIEKNINLKKIDIMKSVVLYTRNPYNFEILRDNSLQFFLNLREVNDFRRINRNFKEINKKLQTNGIFIGRFQSLHQSKNKYYIKYPNLIARCFHVYFFLFKRVIPKLPILKKFYFTFTKGHKRLISEAEALGRLYFCGFEIIDLEEIDNFSWFIVKKVREPLSDKNPSYGLLFKQKRVGKGGKIICIYKFRTMHPYSEYIHHYLYEKQKLDETGKIKNDFRVTSWGKVFRKAWIDEIPMLINLLKGNVKLVGVRPLSKSFFDTYPERIKKERIKYKPGLIPPYYADMPDNIREVWKSEEKYIKKYKQHPFITDFIYFFKALNNILFHHAKSR